LDVGGIGQGADSLTWVGPCETLAKLQVNWGRACRGALLVGSLTGLVWFSGMGCASVSMTAAEARAPIVLGPVGCIGCGIGAERPREGAWQTARARRRAVGALTMMDSGNEKSRLFNRDLTTVPCAEDFQLSKLRATSWSVTIPILFYFMDLTIDAEVERTKVPNGSCLSALTP
jgi:hypothetical protein